MKKSYIIKLGLIGCGEFGRFCLNSYFDLPNLKVTAVADLDEGLVKEIAQKYAIKWYIDPRLLITDSDVDMVHIATPPSTHYSISKLALQNNKHVLCEKPLATANNEAEELLNLSNRNKSIIPVDFVLRYVPIVEIVKKIIKSQILGIPLHAYFENYASDEKLSVSHWFWDKNQSGGIFIEHGVHFFDLYEYWFGETNVLWARTEIRPNTSQEDRVFCVLHHESGVLSNHYHGFDQPRIMDRQRHQILFEKGDIVIEGWIPISLTIFAIMDEKEISILKSMCANAEFTIENLENQEIKGRGKFFHNSKKVIFRFTDPLSKMERYSKAVCDLIIDQIKYLSDSTHQRIITEINGVKALKLALKATKISQENTAD